MVIRFKLLYREKKINRLLLFIILLLCFTIAMCAVEVEDEASKYENTYNTAVDDGSGDAVAFDYDKWDERAEQERNFIFADILNAASKFIYFIGMAALFAVLYEDTVLSSNRYGVLKTMGFTNNMLTKLIYVRYIQSVLIAAIGANIVAVMIFGTFCVKMIVRMVIMISLIVLEIGYFAIKVNNHKGNGNSLEKIEDNNFKKRRNICFDSKVKMICSMALREARSYMGFGTIIVIVVILLVLTCNSIGVFCYNTLVKTENFTNSFFVNASDIDVFWKNRQSRYDNEEKMLMELNCEIDRAINFVDMEVGIGGIIVDAFVSDSFEDVDTPMCFKGRSPLHKNEIAIGYVLANKIDASIGDEIRVVINEKSCNYLVTGLLQSADMGLDCELTTQGFMEIYPAFDFASTSIYIGGNNKEKNIEECVKFIESNYSQEIISCDNKYVYCKELLENYKSMIKYLAFIVMFMTVMITQIFLSLALRGFSMSKREHIRVMKVYGFSKKDILVEEMFGIVVYILMGAVFGGIISVILLPTLYSRLFISIGVQKPAFDYPINVIFTITAGVLLFITVFSGIFILRKKDVNNV